MVEAIWRGLEVQMPILLRRLMQELFRLNESAVKWIKIKIQWYGFIIVTHNDVSTKEEAIEIGRP